MKICVVERRIVILHCLFESYKFLSDFSGSTQCERQHLHQRIGRFFVHEMLQKRKPPQFLATPSRLFA